MPSLSFCLARGLSILLVFSKNEHMVLLIYSIIWLFSILISTLMLLSLDFICYSFYDFLRWIFRSLIFNFSSFPIYFNLINFPLTRGLAASHEFLYVLFSLSSKYFMSIVITCVFTYRFCRIILLNF